ncbi:hypothetical protein NMY22_g20089 [Coprinellus aureogranulatus]|nr:hypothetical protein NMY22_g20089 [Coprinellus aureogranulatus]
MRLTHAFHLTPLLLLVTNAIAVAHALPTTSDAKAAGVLSEAITPVTGTVNTNGSKYYSCPHASCQAIGQYNNGKVITIRCKAVGDSNSATYV